MAQSCKLNQISLRCDVLGIYCRAEILDCGVCETCCDVSKEEFCYDAWELGCDDENKLGCGEAVVSCLGFGALEMGYRAGPNLVGFNKWVLHSH